MREESSSRLQAGSAIGHDPLGLCYQLIEVQAVGRQYSIRIWMGPRLTLSVPGRCSGNPAAPVGHDIPLVCEEPGI